MTSAKHYIRVTNDWQEILYPNENNTYFANVSGITANVLITKNKIEDPSTISDKDHYFSVGGTLAQLRASPDEYVYARALTDSDTEQGAMIVDIEHINADDITGVREEIESISVQIMNLTNRVTKKHMWEINHGIDYELLARQFCDSVAQAHLTDNDLHKHVANIWEELFKAETFLVEHRKYVSKLADELARISNITGTADVRQLQVELNTLAKNLNQVSADVDNLNTEMDRVSSGYDTIMNQEVTPTKESLNNLSKSFASLNNSMTRLALYSTPEEIEAAFNKIIVQVPNDIVNVVSAIRDVLVRTPNADDVLNKDDMVVLDPNSTEVKQAVAK